MEQRVMEVQGCIKMEVMMRRNRKMELEALIRVPLQQKIARSKKRQLELGKRSHRFQNHQNQVVTIKISAGNSITYLTVPVLKTSPCITWVVRAKKTVRPT